MIKKNILFEYIFVNKFKNNILYIYKCIILNRFNYVINF